MEPPFCLFVAFPPSQGGTSFQSYSEIVRSRTVAAVMSDSREDMYRELELADLNPYQGWWLPEDAATLDPGAHAVSGMASSNPEDHLCFIHDIVLGLGPEPKLLVSVVSAAYLQTLCTD